jgi:WD40 repeat protein
MPVALCASRILFELATIPFMSQRLEYQERFNKLAHETVITAMVISPDGRRLVTAGNDSTVLVWSTRSGVTLCRFKAHSPVLSVAWVGSSKGFLFGCKNGMLASVDITEVRSYEFEQIQYESAFAN